MKGRQSEPDLHPPPAEFKVDPQQQSGQDRRPDGRPRGLFSLAEKQMRQEMMAAGLLMWRLNINKDISVRDVEASVAALLTLASACSETQTQRTQVAHQTLIPSICGE